MPKIKTSRLHIQKELGSVINKNTRKKEIDPDIELDKMEDNSSDENPYRELIVNNVGKVESILSQMEPVVDP